MEHALLHALGDGADGVAAEDPEVAADRVELRGDGAARFEGQTLLGGVESKQLGLERGRVAQGAGDAREDLVTVGGAEAPGEDGVVWGVGSLGLLEDAGELVGAAHEQADEEEGEEPAQDGEQTHCGCRGVGQARGWCHSGHRAGLKHEVVVSVKIDNYKSHLFYLNLVMLLALGGRCA